MSWKDEEIDKLFGEAADQQDFEYRPEYWKDIEKQLPINKNYKRPLWWWSASVFIIGFLGLMIFEVPENTKDGGVSVSNRSELSKLATSDRDEINKGIGSSDEPSISKYLVESEVDRNENLKNPNADNSSEISDRGLNFNSKKHDIVKSETIKSYGDTQIDLLTGPQIENLMEKVVIEKSILKHDLSLMIKPITCVRSTPQLLNSTGKALKTKLNRFFVEINGGIGQSWSRQEEQYGSVNGFTGASFGYSFPVNKFSISSGLGVQAMKFNNLNIMDRTKIYGFGSSIIENSYEFSSIYSLSIPIEIHYSKGRHSINAGIKTTMNILTRLKHSQNIDGNRTSYSSGVSGVSYFNRFGVQPTIGYSYFVNEKTQFGARFELQLIEPLKSNRFIGVHQKMPFDGQIFLRRTLDF